MREGDLTEIRSIGRIALLGLGVAILVTFVVVAVQFALGEFWANRLTPEQLASTATNSDAWLPVVVLVVFMPAQFGLFAIVFGVVYPAVFQKARAEGRAAAASRVPEFIVVPLALIGLPIAVLYLHLYLVLLAALAIFYGASRLFLSFGGSAGYIP